MGGASFVCALVICLGACYALLKEGLAYMDAYGLFMMSQPTWRIELLWEPGYRASFSR